MESIMVICCLILPLIGFTLGKVGFIKDQSLDAVFPPQIRASATGLPDGHLRPLGYQRTPDARVSQESDPVSPAEFTKYVNQRRPVVMKKALNKSLAMEKWDVEDKYLVEKYGSLDVHVTVKKQKMKRVDEKMKLRAFLRDYMYEDWYLTNTTPREMMNEIELPNCIHCGTYRKYLVQSELWMSSGGTASMLHYHGDHNLHCLLAGRKDFILIEPQHEDMLDVHEQSPHAGSGYSRIDTEMVNMFQHDNLKSVPWSWAKLQPGDCIYIPAGHLHQVRSYGRSLSATVQWSPTPGVDTSDCVRMKPGPVTLADGNFVWTYSNGTRELTNAKLNPVTLRHHILSLLRADRRLHFGRFELFYNETLSQVENRPPALGVFNLMDVNRRTYLGRNEIIDLSDVVLQAVCDALNDPRSPDQSAHRHDEL